jgi:hypothetical protein
MFLICSGYVALAVAGQAGTETRESNTQSAERAVNMVAFAKEGLQLLKEVVLAGGGGDKL